MNHLGQFRSIFDHELDLIRSWRNHPFVRLNMYTRHEITKEEHQLWWEKVQKNKSQKYLMYELDGIPMGVVSFINIDKVNFNSSWAFYASPEAVKGTGTKMEYLALDYAYNDLSLHKLSCEVLGFNTSVIKLHKKFGFKVEGILREHHKIDNEFVDIYYLGLLSEEWKEQRPVIKKVLDRLIRK